ncbi:hypothetical protein Slin15195_G020210 [Septoria linicola]|uniref:Uncharacterized protein n=1 Tax=Septoria linicola TaxID=215465 RepID=A0A9Q9AMF6_9PEZI|nr:hypothetical protein Slin15195_G020210 [Septoria linicola]
MPPVPVHIDDPITPQKPADSAPPATTTQQQPAAYPAAQPGAAAVPAPTGTPYIQNQYQPQPTRTTTITNNYGPPPPQPGAVPMPPSQQQAAAFVTSLPPPPKAGEAAKLREQIQQQQPVTITPAQMAMSPPEQNYAPTHTTSTTTPARAGSNAGPTTLNFGAVTPIAGGIAPASHPPGYQQNAMAQEMSSAARASLDATERRESLAGGGVFGGAGLTGGAGSGGEGGSVWDTVKGYATAAQKGLIEVEQKAWDRINKST